MLSIICGIHITKSVGHPLEGKLLFFKRQRRNVKFFPITWNMFLFVSLQSNIIVALYAFFFLQSSKEYMFKIRKAGQMKRLQ